MYGPSLFLKEEFSELQLFLCALVFSCCHNKVPQTGSLKTKEVHTQSSRGKKSRIQGGACSLSIPGENLFLAFLLALGLLDSSMLFDPQPHHSASTVTWHPPSQLCFLVFLLMTDTVIWNLGLTQKKCDLVLISYICNNCISKKHHFRGSRKVMNLGKKLSNPLHSVIRV